MKEYFVAENGYKPLWLDHIIQKYTIPVHGQRL